MDFNVEIDLKRLLSPKWANKLQKWQFTAREQQAFLEDLSTLVGDGLPATYAVEMVGKITKRGGSREVAKSILQKISEGKGLAEGMEGWFPIPIVELVRAGERGGTLTDTLAFAASTLGESNSVIGSFITNLIYPILVIIMGCGVSVFVNKTVFKQFLSIKPLNQWPENGQMLVIFSHFIEDWWWIIVLMIVGIIYGMSHVYRNYTGTYRKLIDNLPVLSIYRRLAAARFMEVLGMLVANGIAFKQAIKIIEYNATPYMASHLLQMEYRLGAGKSNIADVLDTGLIEKSDILRLEAVSNVSGVEQALIRLGSHARQQGQATIKLTGKILGGILLALGAGLAAFMVFSIYGVGSTLAA